MNILKYKYKAHKLVNTLFYLFVFLIGFVVGFTIKTFNFSNLLSEILMIDNVKAYTFYENENVKIDEDFIYKSYKQKFPFFDMSTYKNVACNFISNQETLEPSYFYCIAFDDNSKNAITLNYSSASRYVFKIPSPSYYIYWTYDIELNEFLITDFSNKTDNYDLYVLFTASHVQVRTNFNFDLASAEHNTKFNQLNFDKYTLGYSDIETKPTTDNYNNEEYIYNLFNEVMEKSGYNSKLEDYSNVLLYNHTSGVHNKFYYWFSTEEFTGSYTDVRNTGSYYQLLIDIRNKKASLEYVDKTDNITNIFAGATYSNQMATTSTGVTGVGKYLDFTDYTLDLVFDENLFKNDPNFKEVCVNNYDKFSIISNEVNYLNNQENYKIFGATDFIWFKNGLSGLKTYMYDTHFDNNVFHFGDSPLYPLYDDFYWLNSTQVINEVFSSDSGISLHLNEKGYIDKYSYYNYSLHPFLISFDYVEKQYVFNVFWFENPQTLYLSSDDNIDDTEEEYSNKYCFYVKKEFDVIIHNTNEWGDITTNTTILGGENIDFSTSENESNVNNQGLFSVITNFSSKMSTTILFINSNINKLYLSLPLIVRMFILAALTLFFIKYLIDMIVR